MFSKNLKKIRESRRISQKKLADALHVSQQTVGSWEVGRTTPSVEMMTTIASIFDITLEELVGYTGVEKSPRTPGVRIPVYGDVAAGIPILAIENYDSNDPDDWEEITRDMARNGDHIALRIHGDSMEPKISNGDVVIVRLQPDVESGEIAIVRVNGDDATCKKIKKTPEGIMLISTNPEYEPMFYSKKDVRDLPVAIIGKVVELRAKF